jgi:hypothetical protein
MLDPNKTVKEQWSEYLKYYRANNPDKVEKWRVKANARNREKYAAKWAKFRERLNNKDLV